MSAADVRFPSFDLTGRVALVTGAARGLGEAIALALAHAGADVVLGLRDASTAPPVAAAIERLGRRAVPVQMDVTSLARSRVPSTTRSPPLGRHRHPRQQRRPRAGERGRGRQRGRLRLHLRRQPQGHVLRQPGGRPGDDPPGLRDDRQPGLPGGRSRAARRVGVLHDEGRDRPPHPLPGGRVGRARHHRQRGRPDLHLSRRAPSRRSRTRRSTPTSLERIAGLHRIGEPMDVAGAVVFLASPGRRR